MSDLQKAFKTLFEKQALYNRLWNYYDGYQPLKYSSERLKDVFNTIDVRFVQNWCGVVVDSVIERMIFKQFVVANNEMDTTNLNNWWVNSEMSLDADDVELCAIVTGESFVFAWMDEDGMPMAFYNDSRLAHAWYDDENPRVMTMAAKWFAEADGSSRLTLYYPNRLEYYASETKLTELRHNHANTFFPLPVAGGMGEDGNRVTNPFNLIPVFHFRRERRAIRSELTVSIRDMQDAVNKLIADMMITSEYSSFPQRYVISNADGITGLKNSPNEIWDIPAGDGLSQPTSVGQFQQADLDKFLTAVKDLAASISVMSRTPQHYFLLGARSDPSGEALISMESPLNKKVKKYITRFEAEWRRLGAFVMGQSVASVQAIYDDPLTIQPLTQAQTRATNVQAGIPLRTQLRREGWSNQDLEMMDTDKEMEAQASQNNLAVALLNAERRMSQGDENE